MTNSVEFPLRPYTQDWPGLNSTGGKTMRVGGELSDCTNVQINRGDTLEKRKGFVRALDERFEGVVCGLFTYLDDCGNEWLLVADQISIKVRQPFVFSDVPTLDCYPNDGFDDEELSPTLWRNTDSYITTSGRMKLLGGSQENNLQQGIDSSTRWFKDACSTSHNLQLQFVFDTSAKSRILAIIRGTDDLASSMLIAELSYDPSASTRYTLRVIHRDEALNENEISKAVFNSSIGAVTGFLTISYDATERIVTTTATITGGNQTLKSAALSEVASSALGMVSAIGIGQTGSSFPANTALLQVIGNSV